MTLLSPPQQRALLEMFATLQFVLEDATDNPLGRNLPDVRALAVCRGGLGQLRREYQKTKAVLEGEA